MMARALTAMSTTVVMTIDKGILFSLLAAFELADE
jgi:hypothetical protein